jgi:hypothetical protein
MEWTRVGEMNRILTSGDAVLRSSFLQRQPSVHAGVAIGQELREFICSYHPSHGYLATHSLADVL